MRVFNTLEELAVCVGQEVAVSDWIEVNQERIDQFAQATGDHQWIHVDPERAKAGPFGTTIAASSAASARNASLSSSTGTPWVRIWRKVAIGNASD